MNQISASISGNVGAHTLEGKVIYSGKDILLDNWEYIENGKSISLKELIFEAINHTSYKIINFVMQNDKRTPLAFTDQSIKSEEKYYGELAVLAIMRLNPEEKQQFLSDWFTDWVNDKKTTRKFLIELFGDYVKKEDLEDVPIDEPENEMYERYDTFPFELLLKEEPQIFQNLKLPDLNELKIGGKFTQGESVNKSHIYRESLCFILKKIFPNEEDVIDRQFKDIILSDIEYMCKNIFDYSHFAGVEKVFEKSSSLVNGNDEDVQNYRLNGLLDVLNNDAYVMDMSNANEIYKSLREDKKKELINTLGQNYFTQRLISKTYSENDVIFEINTSMAAKMVLMLSELPELRKIEDSVMEKGKSYQLKMISSILSNRENVLNDLKVSSNSEEKALLEETLEVLERKIADKTTAYYLSNVLWSDFEKTVKNWDEYGISVDVTGGYEKSSKGNICEKVRYIVNKDAECLFDKIFRESVFWLSKDCERNVGVILDNYLMRKDLEKENNVQGMSQVNISRKRKF